MKDRSKDDVSTRGDKAKGKPSKKPVAKATSGTPMELATTGGLTDALAPTLPEKPGSSTRSHPAGVAQYDVLEEIARGGVGRILRAWDRRLERTVALKELHTPDPELRRRFEREISITARLQHPAIVPVHEAGEWPSGEPFYVMKLVEGRSLAQAIHDADFPEERMALLGHIVAAAEAMAYAHSQGIIHRDLKPANVMVGPFGETAVIDWGLAKELGDDKGDLSQSFYPPRGHVDGSGDTTVSGAVLGTPAYMAPEQAAGDRVDKRADVYALGAMLYQLVAGVRPFSGVPGRDLLHVVMTQSPRPLSEAAPDAAPDLIAIVNKAMRREEDARYANAGEMADELKRFVAGLAVRAYDYSPWERVGRFVERYRIAVGTLAVSLVLLVALGGYSYVQIRAQALAESEARQEAEAAEARATRRLQLARLQSARAELLVDPTLAIARLKTLESDVAGAASVAADAEQAGVARWVLRSHSGRVVDLAFSPDSDVLASSSDDGRAIVWSMDTGEPRVLQSDGGRTPTLAFHPSGERLATGNYDGSVRVWNLETGEEHRPLPAHQGPVGSVAFSPDGQWLASISADQTTRVWNWRSGASRVTQTEVDRTMGVAFSADSSMVAALGRDAQIWSHQQALQPVSIHAELVAFGGDWIVSAGEDVRVHHDEGHASSLGHGGHAQALAVSNDQRWAATGGLDRVIRVWDLEREVLAQTLVGHDEQITSLSFSPDAEALASASFDTTGRLWDLSSGASRVLRGHRDVVSTIRFSPDGVSVATSSWDRTVRVWDVPPRRRWVLRGHTVGVHSVDFSPDGSQVVSGAHDHSVRLWDVATGEGRILGEHGDHVFRVRFSPNGEWVASSSDDQTVRLWNTSVDHAVTFTGHSADVEELAFSPSGEFVASGGEDNSVGLWHVDESAGGLLRGHTGHVSDVAFASDERLISAGLDGSIWQWNTRERSGEIFAQVEGPIVSLRVSSQGAIAAAGDELSVWDSGGNQRVFDVDSPHLVRFSPDGNHVAAASRDRVWVCASRGECRELPGQIGRVNALAFSPNARSLLIGAANGVLRLYDVASGESRAYRGHGSAVFGVSFSADGRMMASASGDETVQLWVARPPPSPDGLQNWMAELTNEVLEDESE